MRTAFFFVTYYSVFVYPWWRLVDKLAPGFEWGPPALVLLLAGPAVLWVASRKVLPPLRYWIARTVYVWLGAGWLLLCLTLPFEGLYLLFPQAERGLALALLASLAVLVAGSVVNATRFEVKTIQLTSSKIAVPLRAVQISDVHVGSRTPRFLSKVVDAVNALEADVIFITGDLIDGQAVPRSELQVLSTLNAPTIFIIGNHERYVDCDDICARLSSLGLRVLRNATERICVGNVELCVTGIDDAEDPRQVAEVLTSMEPAWEDFADSYSVLLYHRPDGLEDAAARGFDLMLCGHTHNGQMIPFNTLVKRRFPRIKGLYRVDPTTLYVSVGTGTWGPPMRLGSVNELTLFEFTPPRPGLA